MRYFTVFAEIDGVQNCKLNIPVKIEGVVNSITLLDAAKSTRGYEHLRINGFNEWVNESQLLEYHNPPLL